MNRGKLRQCVGCDGFSSALVDRSIELGILSLDEMMTYYCDGIRIFALHPVGSSYVC